MLTLSQQKHVAIWQKLRQPFVLPRAGISHHKCNWERLDIDLFGCTLCSNIHACNERQCENCIETGDGTVCSLSGVVVRNCKFVEEEFMENVHLVNFHTSWRVFDQDVAPFEIDTIITHILTSDTTLKLHIQELWKTCDKLRQMTRSEIAVGACAHFCKALLKSNQLTAFNLKQRQCMAKTCVAQCCGVMQTLVYNFGMLLKPTETQYMAVGTLYLMRVGVRVHDLTILHQHPSLQYMLPPESSLDQYFNIKPKCITDAENNIKSNLRHVSRAKLISAGFQPVSDSASARSA